MGVQAMTDPIEDLLAFLYATEKLPGTKSQEAGDADDDICSNCGADLEDDESGCKRCPVCGNP